MDDMTKILAICRQKGKTGCCIVIKPCLLTLLCPTLIPLIHLVYVNVLSQFEALRPIEIIVDDLDDYRGIET
ncbi:hypothetical protein FGO68_gene13235 [Halteria grandinella]|uniref:Uncharacterized protein n=1 Tax=Halteria grandinella TaxID=5974 RepID=A0A8J8NFP8_HALGN|nr:hypothetical protein FGO68_gene13235 [Halteria grandinella]